jgi:hypothetical protein
LLRQSCEQRRHVALSLESHLRQAALSRV